MPHDPVKLLCDMLNAAERGDPAAMLLVADRLAEDANSRSDESRATRWYQKAAHAGVVEAMYELARRYCLGYGVPRDVDACRSWLQRAYAADNLLKLRTERTVVVREEVLAMLVIIERAS